MIKKKGAKKDNWATFFLILGILCIAFAPWIMVCVIDPVSFMTTGEIGDTIGGITAPIASLLGSLLVYRALQAQVKANNIIVAQFEDQKKDGDRDRVFENIMDRIKFLRDDIHEFYFGQSKGFQAIDTCLHTWAQYGPHNPDNPYTLYTRQIGSILSTINGTIIYIELSYLEDSEKKNLRDIIKNTYFKILPYLHRERIELPDDIAPLYKEINEKFDLKRIDELDDIW